MPHLARSVHTAVVTRTPLRPHDPSQYLLLTPEGSQIWIQDPEAATTFASMKEAMRAALRLPGALRAYGLPRNAEIALGRTVH